MQLSNQEVIARAGAHLIQCKELLALLDDAGMMVRGRPEVAQARTALEESMRLTRALVVRVQIELEGANGDNEQ